MGEVGLPNIRVLEKILPTKKSKDYLQHEYRGFQSGRQQEVY